MFVVVYGNGAVLPELVNGRAVNMTSGGSLCVWFNDAEVRFYRNVSIDEIGGPVPIDSP